MSKRIPIRLNIGSRGQQMPGYQGIDCDPHDGVDMVGDAASLHMFENESVEEIYASHILEHFSHTKTATVLKEWYRVLVSGGVLRVAVPDFRRAVEIYLAKGLREFVENHLVGDQGYHTAYHYALFDEDKLSSLLKSVGFSDVTRVEQFGLNSRDCSNLVSTADGKSVSLNLVAVK